MTLSHLFACRLRLFVCVYCPFLPTSSLLTRFLCIHSFSIFPSSGSSSGVLPPQWAAAASSRNGGFVPPHLNPQTQSHIPQKTDLPRTAALWPPRADESRGLQGRRGFLHWLRPSSARPWSSKRVQGSHTRQVGGSPKEHGLPFGREKTRNGSQMNVHPATTTPESQTGHTSVWLNYEWMHTHIVP